MYAPCIRLEIKYLSLSISITFAKAPEWPRPVISANCKQAITQLLGVTPLINWSATNAILHLYMPLERTPFEKVLFKLALPKRHGWVGPKPCKCGFWLVFKEYTPLQHGCVNQDVDNRQQSVTSSSQELPGKNVTCHLNHYILLLGAECRLHAEY